MNKVIWVTSFFPPHINVASARNAKLLKYLPDNGWEVVVLCPKYSIAPTEASNVLLGQLKPSIRVSAPVSDRFISMVARRNKSRIARYISYVMNNTIPPDGHLFWALSILRHLEQEIIRFKPDLLYTTCNPYSLNFIGAWAKAKFGLPWVTDFRDLWTLNQQPRRVVSLYHRAVSSHLERKYMRSCSFLIANTDCSKRRMASKYPELVNKTAVVPNGFDPQDTNSTKIRKVIKKTFLYSGSIVPNTTYHPLGILKLLSLLSKSGKLSKEWSLHYAGEQGDVFEEYAEMAGVDRPCIVHGYLDHTRYYKLIRQMDHVMMTLPSGVDCRSWIPSRFYDYLGNKVSIICLAPKRSEVFELLKKYKRGVALCYEDSESINLKMLNQYLESPPGKQVVSNDFIARFSRKKQAERLSDIFKTVISQPSDS